MVTVPPFRPEKVRLGELDPPIVELVRLLNEFDGIATIGSCGGHDDGRPGGMHASANEWWVTFELEPATPDGETTAPSDRAWLELEFLVYVIETRGLRGGPYAMSLGLFATLPHMNEPGRMLRFQLSGERSSENGIKGIEPDELARLIREKFEELTSE